MPFRHPVFTTKAILRTGIWGEMVELQRAGAARLRKIRSVAPMTWNASTRHVWEQFLNVRDGRAPKASPPELGLRMARLWDAIRESTACGGAVIAIPTATTPIVPIAGGPTAPVLPAPTLAEAVG